MVDPDLLRDLLLTLEKLQRSPPESMLVSLGEVSARLNREGDDVEEAFAILSRLALIEGPGRYGAGWLFRQLTPRGRLMADQVDSTRQWKRIKKAYGVAG